MRSISILVLGAALAGGPASARHEQSDVPPEVAASRARGTNIRDPLKDALQQAIQDGGPVNGIAVCHEKAGQIAADLGQKQEMLVGRTSLKLRNPANAPDNWELAVLKQFEARKAQGEPGRQTGVLRGHRRRPGQENLPLHEGDSHRRPLPELPRREHRSRRGRQTENELYPNDKARGFKEGELRGAFTLSKPLP
jgi:hypothetical protein